MSAVQDEAEDVAKAVADALAAYRAKLDADIGRVLGAPFPLSLPPQAAAARERNGGAGGNGKVAPRRPPTKEAHTTSAILDALRGAGKTGVNAARLRGGMPRPVFKRAIAELLAAKKVRKTGVKRGTTYFAK